MTHEECTAVRRETLAIPGRTRGWLGHAFSEWEQHVPIIYALPVLGSPLSWAGGTVLQPGIALAEWSWGADPWGIAGLGSDPNSAWWSQSGD